MRTDKIICAAMVCCALAAGFSSCSKDEDPSDVNKREWVLASISRHSGVSNDGSVSWPSYVIEFSYDSEGRVIEDGDEEVTYRYSSDQIQDSEGSKFSLNGNGKIADITSNGFMEYANYDDSGNLIEFKTDSYSSIFEWSNGLLMQMDAFGSITTFEYSESTPMNIDCVRILNSKFISYDALDGYWALYFTGYFGNIPSKPICKYTKITQAIYPSKVITSIDYKDIDSNGCPAKMIVKTSQPTDNIDTEVVSDLVWKKL